MTGGEEEEERKEEGEEKVAGMWERSAKRPA